MTSSILPDFEGGPRSFTIVRDVSQRERARHELEASEIRLRQILDASTDGYWEVGLQDGRAFESARLAELMGYPPEERTTSTREFLGRVHPDDRPAVHRFQEAIERGRA
jgi:PAS domain-containing protein